jgi:adenylate cyclase
MTVAAPFLPHQAPPDNRPVPTRGEILLVDDQEDTRLLISRHLALAGYHVRCAASAEVALRSISERKPDVVLLDVVMQGMNGIDLCRRLKADPSTLSLPVVLVTGLHQPSDRVAGIEAGADDFLTKPVDRAELLARVGSLMRLQEARAALEAARLAIEIQRRERVQRTFERYVSPKLVRAILAGELEPEGLLSRQTRLDAVALFVDLRGFTRMSELLDTDTLVGLLNEFFTLATESVHDHEGTVFNMAGDSLLAGFGVPLAQVDAAWRALDAVETMQRRFTSIAQRWRGRYGVQAGMGAGIDCGPIIAGNVGSPTYMCYTMIGDAVNVAARLMQVAGPGETLITASVLRRAQGHPALGRATLLEDLMLRGKSAPLMTYRIACREESGR